MLDVLRNEPELILEEGKLLGYPYGITHNGIGYLCGYLKVRQGHPWYGMDRESFNVEVHGGITYTGIDSYDDGWWIGFDCCHYNDLPLPDLHLKYPRVDIPNSYGVVRTPAYIRIQLISLIRQMGIHIPMVVIHQLSERGN